MRRRSSPRQKVSFAAKKRVTVPTRVSFKTKSGKRVSFTARKRTSKAVRVTFYKSTKK